MKHISNETIEKIMAYIDKAQEMKCDIQSFVYACYPMHKKSVSNVILMTGDVSEKDAETFFFLVDAFEKAITGMKEVEGVVRRRKSSFYKSDLKPYLPQ